MTRLAKPIIIAQWWKNRGGESVRVTLSTYADRNLGCYVNRSTGARKKAFAEKFRKKLERDIESGVLANKEATGFAAAAEAYMMAGGDNRFLLPLIDHFIHTPEIRLQHVELR